MKAVFIEMTEFTEWVSEYLPDEAYARLQQELMDNPNKGTPIPGCGGLRKVRTADPKRGKGKRGGARVIYLYIVDAKWFYLIDIYDKDEKVDLSTAEKQELTGLTAELKQQSKAAINRRSRRKK
jgi:putative transcriptional regulator